MLRFRDIGVEQRPSGQPHVHDRERLCQSSPKRPGLGAEDAQQLILELQRGRPESRAKIEMNPQVRAFRARLVSEIREAEAKGWFLDFTLEFIAPPR